MPCTQGIKGRKEIWINLIDIWENSISDAIEQCRDSIDFSVMPVEDFKEECVDLIEYYFENEMLGPEINYTDVVFDTAKQYDMWNC